MTFIEEEQSARDSEDDDGDLVDSRDFNLLVARNRRVQKLQLED